MQTEIIHGSIVFEQLANEWDQLADGSVTDTPFQTLAYQKTWWTHLRPSNAALYTIILRSDAGELLAIACLYIYDGLIHFNGCVEETDYLDIIAAADHLEAAWTAVFQTLNSDGFPDWDVIDLCNVPAESPTRTIVAQLAETNGFQFQETIHEVCPIVALPDSFNDYLSGLDSKQRREVRRKLRRATGAEAQLVIIGPNDDLTAAVDEFLILLQKSMYEKRDWLNDGRRALFHETARAAMDNGTLQLMFLEVNGRKGAALFNFDYKGRIWVYNSGLDPEAFGNLSLGVVLTAKSIENAIENGRKDFDFLRGNEIYKYRFGAKDTEIFRLHIVKAAK